MVERRDRGDGLIWRSLLVAIDVVVVAVVGMLGRCISAAVDVEVDVDVVDADLVQTMELDDIF